MALMKSILSILMLMTCINASFGCELPAYYGRTELELSRDPLTLKTELQKILKWNHVKRIDQVDLILESCPENETCISHRLQTYKRARQFLFGFLHLDKSEVIVDGQAVESTFIRDVYCQRDFRDDDFPRDKPKIGDFGTLETPSEEIPFHEVLNTEHTWPRSRFNKAYDASYQDVDLHHLFPSDNEMNSVRGNFPFCEVERSLPVKCENCKLGYSKHIEGVNEEPGDILGEKVDRRLLCFEPVDAHKGNVARALFYFATRYQLSIEPQEEHFLKKWNNLDPIDEFEKTRNDRVFEIQGTRNPFIDNPNWADVIADF